MNKSLPTALFLCLILFSCISSKKTSSQSNIYNQQTIEAAPAEHQDGSSFAKAIIIRENSTSSGIKAEYAWIREHYPDSKVVTQQLYHEGKKSYDVLTVEKSNGDQQKVYFNITRFFGKL
jgi:hypothetical protein